MLFLRAERWIVKVTKLLDNNGECPVVVIHSHFSRRIKIIPKLFKRDKRWCSWLRHCNTNRKVAGLILDEVIGIFL